MKYFYEKNNISEVFEMIEFSDLEDFKKIVNESNVNIFINEFGQNLLHEAVTQDAPEIFNYLLYCNIDINKLDRDGKTPLHYSTQLMIIIEYIHKL
ncbi:ankyrin repeat domain-containing protein [Chryseobacterium antibioticum]|uniref:Ankyrin repeat domain-containing protein n=1 Tax=Chryseobacterium pyrolae TaxID=2987481 RepID=A0ABT2IKV9_9FLAO|nr:ankyrin repeat domain-containing protein [Chryseobacterium pyrolae]MCT2409288.1 ankyrin repeat domain-containing protein [Chryseobacterium pyrolae]